MSTETTTTTRRSRLRDRHVARAYRDFVRLKEEVKSDGELADHPGFHDYAASQLARAFGDDPQQTMAWLFQMACNTSLKLGLISRYWGLRSTATAASSSTMAPESVTTPQTRLVPHRGLSVCPSPICPNNR